MLVNNAGGNTDFAEEPGGGLAGGGALVHVGSIGAEQGGAYGAAKAAPAS